MEKLFMVLVICVFVKAVENRHHPKFVRAFEEYERSKTPQPVFEKVPCSSTMDDERDSLIKKAKCGAPKEVFYELNHVPRAAHEEIYPGAVWVKRCVGLCDDEGTDSKCMPRETIKRQIPIKIVNTKTWKESCSLYTIEEHVSCQCCRGSPESCKADGKVFMFNPRKCGCQCPNLEERHACLSKRNQNMRWNRSKCTCEARRRIK